MDNQIVLVTGGKNSDAYLVCIKLFDTKSEAIKYCISVNVDNDKKYWRRAEMISKDIIYEIAQDGNYTGHGECNG